MEVRVFSAAPYLQSNLDIPSTLTIGGNHLVTHSVHNLPFWHLLLQHQTLPRELGKRHTSGCLLRERQSHHQRKGKDQGPQDDNQKPPLATSKTSCIIKPNVNQSLHASNRNRLPNYLTTDTTSRRALHLRYPTFCFACCENRIQTFLSRLFGFCGF